MVSPVRPRGAGVLPRPPDQSSGAWRQAVRWLAQSAPEPVTITLPAAPAPGDGIAVAIAARDKAYAPRADAILDVRVTSPSGRVETVHADPVPSQGGQFRAAVRASEPGIYRVAVDARQGQAVLGSSTGTMLVGGVDPEMTDPRLNEDTLQRVAHASGGVVLAAGDMRGLIDRLSTAAPAAMLALRTDLGHTGWSFAILAGLLAAEWLTARVGAEKRQLMVLKVPKVTGAAVPRVLTVLACCRRGAGDGGGRYADRVEGGEQGGLLRRAAGQWRQSHGRRFEKLWFDDSKILTLFDGGDPNHAARRTACARSRSSARVRRRSCSCC